MKKLATPALKGVILIVLLPLGLGKSFSQWSNNTAINTPVCIAAKYQHEVRVIPDGKGGAIAAWLDHRNDATFPTPDSSNADIYVQRLDKNGYAKWTLNGIGICVHDSDQPAVNIVTDGASGAIIVWRDQRNGNSDVYAQRVDSGGIEKWTSGGVPVCNGTDNQKGAKAVSDGNGGAIVCWESKGTTAGADWKIRVQKINSSGSISWATLSTGILLTGSTSNDEFNARIETDGNGGAIVAWEHEIDTADYDIYAQRVDNAGNELWTIGGVVVTGAATLERDAKLEPDGSNGAIIVWQDSTFGNIYAQRINSSGGKPWGNNPIIICNDTSYQGAHDVASEGTNGVVIAWKDLRFGNKDVYAQKIDLNGNILWAANGIALTTGMQNEGNPNVWGDGFGNVICVYQDSMAPLNTLVGNITAQKIDANGNLLWGTGVPVGTATNQQTQPKHVPDGAGGAIFFFQDNRTPSLDYDIYAQRLLSDGTLPDGVFQQEVLVESNCYPNPFNKSATVQLANIKYQASDLYFLVYNAFGQRVNPSVTNNADGFLIRRGTLLQGIYFYKIKSKDNTTLSIGKFIITN